jgi:hypothetical protein
MNTIDKYQLELSSEDDKYTKLRIGDLHVIYTDNEYRYTEFSGVCALVRHSEYDGYCTLCAVHNEVFGGFYRVELAPLYDEYGNKILVRYDHDCLFAIISVENKPGFVSNNDDTKIFIKIPKHGCSIGLDNLK